VYNHYNIRCHNDDAEGEQDRNEDDDAEGEQDRNEDDEGEDMEEDPHSWQLYIVLPWS